MKVLSVIPSHVLHTNVINYQAEGDGEGGVLEEAEHVGNFEVSGGS